jgi:hypothetical protein
LASLLDSCRTEALEVGTTSVVDAHQDHRVEIKPRSRRTHYPPGTSKWNKIEHRMFSFISAGLRRDFRVIPGRWQRGEKVFPLRVK